MIFSINPRTEEKIYEFKESTDAEIFDAFKKSKAAQRKWYASSSKEERVDLIRTLVKNARHKKSHIVDIMHSETGIPKTSLASAYEAALSGTDYYIERYLNSISETIPLPLKCANTDANVHFVPHGTLAHIGIWNFPFWQTMITAIPALLTGNSIVYKPSDYCTASGLAISELINSSGFPEGIYVPLVGGGDVGRKMVRSDCDAVVFTGGIDTGRNIIENAGVKPLILELSGNDACIVCSDADIEQAARGIVTGTFSRGGQVCIRIKRVYVHKDIANDFLERLLEITSNLSLEDDVGPLIRNEARTKVSDAVDEAIRDGAELLCGGKSKSPGYYYEPTIFTHSNENLREVREETFGPVCPVRIVSSDEEAMRFANDTHYGLGGTIWSQDFERAKKLADCLEVGNAWINECGSTLPGGEYFQGWKQSGIPSPMSRLDLFTKKKTIISHCSAEPRAKWYS